MFLNHIGSLTPVLRLSWITAARVLGNWRKPELCWQEAAVVRCSFFKAAMHSVSVQLSGTAVRTAQANHKGRAEPLD